MSLDHYELSSSRDYLSYEFNSEGPKGKIKKVVHYTKLKSSRTPIYNLGFGDYNEETDGIDDLTVSNNEDRDLILRTVASTVRHFFSKFPDVQITFNGSTEARTRLYIMQISKYLAEIDKSIEIFGLNENGLWESFRKKWPLLSYIGDSDKKRKLNSMGTSLKRKRSKTVKKRTIIVSKKVKDYGNDPFFIKKAKQMETILKKHGLPN